jgi:hypothetical protein
MSMKKLVFMSLLVGSLLIGTTVVNAAGDGAMKSKDKMKYVSFSEQINQIKELIEGPDLILKDASRAVVNFDISEDNRITVNEIKTDNIELEKFIFEQMNGKKIKGNNVEMKNMMVAFVFRNEK